MRKIKLNKLIKIIILLFSFLGLAFSTYKIISYIKDSKKTNLIIENLDENIVSESSNTGEEINPPSNKESDYWAFMKIPFINVDFDFLLSQNKDTVAWINVNNTNINYPIVQTKNNTYYLKHAFDKTYNGAGWLFMDYRNDAVNWGTNSIIYGHSMLNTTMFGTLLKARKSSWYTNKDNWVIKMSTPTENTLWQIFSLYETDVENYYITTDFDSNEEKLTFFETLEKRSKYNFNAELTENDKILTLSTCSSSTYDKRFVIHAKLIKREIR